MKVIKLLSILLALGVLLFALTACEEKKEPEVTSTSEEVVVEKSDIIDGMPNPVVQYDSVEDAVIVVGHLCPLPSIYERYNKNASVISGKLIQIDYSDDSGDILTLREEARPSGDISGVYNEYPYDEIVKINDIDVNVRGTSGDAISLVTWNDGAYSHSLYYVDTRTLEEVTAVVSEING